MPLKIKNFNLIKEKFERAQLDKINLQDEIRKRVSEAQEETSKSHERLGGIIQEFKKVSKD